MNIENVEKVIVLGAGGTGSILINPLARFLSSQKFNGSLMIVDGDSYSESNTDRQIFAAKFVGKNKAEYQATVLTSHIPSLTDQIEFIDSYLGKEEIDELIVENTIVINCVDNIAARKFVQDRIASLDNGVHICCGNELTNGQVQCFVRKNGHNITRPIYDQFPEFNSSNDDRSTMSCEELSALPGGGQLICANMMAASIALNYFMIVTNEHNMFQGGNWVPCDTVAYSCRHNNYERFGEMPLNSEDIKRYREQKAVSI